MYPYCAPLEVSFLCTAWKDAQKEGTALGKGYYFTPMSSREPCAAAALLGERRDRHIGQCLDEPGWLLDTTYAGRPALAAFATGRLTFGERLAK